MPENTHAPAHLRPGSKVPGTDQIAAAFSSAHNQGRAALIPYFTLGYPTPASSLEVIEAIAAAGADLIELGIPFSDPLADGPTIQHSTQVALQQGVSPAMCLEMAATLRSRGVHQPMLFMGYLNPMLAFGLTSFVKQAVDMGISGLIIPDLPPEEATELEKLCEQHGIGLVYLASPNTTPNRLQSIAARTSGFLYLVSLTGVTGERAKLSPGLEEFIERARRVAKTPLAVGFGISTPEQAHAVGQLADGVVVGSAIIRTVGEAESPPDAAARLVVRLLAELTRGQQTRRT